MRWKGQDIPDAEILNYIENSPRFRQKVAKRIGQIYGQRNRQTPERRREIALMGAEASKKARSKKKDGNR